MKLNPGTMYDENVVQADTHYGILTHTIRGNQPRLDLSYYDHTTASPAGLTSERSEASFVFSMELIKDGLDTDNDGLSEKRQDGTAVASGMHSFFWNTAGKQDIDGQTSSNLS